MIIRKIIFAIIALGLFQSCVIGLPGHCPDYEAFQTSLWQFNLHNNELQLIDFNNEGSISTIESFNTQNRILFKFAHTLYSMNFDGFDKKEVHSSFNDPGYDYSLSGQDEKIVFVSEYQNFLLNPDSTETNSSINSRSELLTMDVDGSNISTIRVDSTNRLGKDYWTFTNYYDPAFLFDNDSIIHRTEIKKYSISQNFELSSYPISEDSGIWITNLATRKQQRLTKNSYEYPIYNFDVSNNQQSLTFQTYETGNVIYLQNLKDSTSAGFIASGRSPPFFSR